MTDAVVDDMEHWMRFIPDNLKLNQLTFPGTHNSHATWENYADNEPAIEQPYTTTQSSGISIQLLEGVRYLDIRLGNPNYSMRHGRCQLKGDLFGVMNEIHGFLPSHSDEAVLVSVKWDAWDVQQPEPSDMGKTVWDIWQKYGWFLRKTWPKLGEVRGKAILLRRYGTKVPDVAQDDEYPGIDFDGVWGHESGGPPGAWRQGDDGMADNMAYNDVWSRIWPQINGASEAQFDDDVQYFTFASHNGAKSLTPPSHYAAVLNPRIIRFLNDDNHHEDLRSHRYGCIVVDYFERAYGLEMVARNWESRVFSPDPDRVLGSGSDDPMFTLQSPKGDKVEFFFRKDAVLRVDINGSKKWDSGPPCDEWSDEHKLYFQEDGNLVIWKKGGGPPERGGRSQYWQTATRSGWDSRLRFTAGPPYILVDFMTGDGKVLWSTIPH